MNLSDSLHKIFPIVCLCAVAGCATLATGTYPPVQVHTNSDSVVYVANGTQVSTISREGELALPARAQQLTFVRATRDTLRLTIGRRPNPLTYANLLFPLVAAADLAVRGKAGPLTYAGVTGLLGAVIDRRSGAAWQPEPRRLTLAFPPRPPSPQQPVDSAAVVAETLRRLAAAAYAVGCDSTFPEFWLQERRLYMASDSLQRTLPDSALRVIQRNVDDAVPTLQAGCARANPIASANRRLIEDPPPPGDFALAAPVYFDFDSDVVPDTVLPRLRDFARRLREVSPAVVLVVEGYADPVGRSAYNLSLGQRRAEAVIAVLRAAGNLPSNCCAALSYGSDPAWLAIPPPSGRDRAARSWRLNRYNRRATFYLNVREGATVVPQ